MAQTAQLVMPKLGLTMTEGQLSEWKVGPGQSFRAGEVVFVVETDKIANEVEAEADGRLVEILVEAGETVAVGTPLARLEGSAAESRGRPSDGKAEPAPAATSAQAPTAAPDPSGRILATPLARRLARQGSIDLSALRGSGPRGRIKASDVERAAREPTPVRARGPETSTGGVAGAPEGMRSRPSAAQATIARRLTEAKRDVPHFYVATEAEVSALLALRAGLAAGGDWPKTTLTHWIVAAVGRALVEAPETNRVWDGDEIVELAASDVGVAVDAERGLYVPVLRDAGRRSVGAIAAELSTLVARVRGGGLSVDEVAGGAVTVSNVGMHGITYLTPIINPGQAMILGVGSVRELFRPDGEGQPALRRELGLVLAADHRVINGVAATALLKRVVGLLEQPMRLLTLPV